MNLFILDRQPDVAARYCNDFHVRKIILEAVEMMGYAYDNGRFNPLPLLHLKGKHPNHPMSKWVRYSRQNFDWTLQHAYALLDEFTYRQAEHKQHAYLPKIDWIAANLPLANLPNHGMTDWPRCFGEWKDQIELTDDPVYDYRHYYMVAKRHIALWTRRPQPDWWQ
jgi:hypothetical protein